MKHLDDTPAPRPIGGLGAISIIRVSGKDAFGSPTAWSPKDGSARFSQGYTIKYGIIPEVDEVLVASSAPHSYTGEDSVKFPVTPRAS